MNLKKLANWSWKNSLFLFIGIHFPHFYDKTPVFLKRKQGFFDRLEDPGLFVRDLLHGQLWGAGEGSKILQMGKSDLPGTHFA